MKQAPLSPPREHRASAVGCCSPRVPQPVCRQETLQSLHQHRLCWSQLGSILLRSAGPGCRAGLGCREEGGRKVLHISKFLRCCPRSSQRAQALRGTGPMTCSTRSWLSPGGGGLHGAPCRSDARTEQIFTCPRLMRLGIILLNTKTKAVMAQQCPVPASCLS